MQKISLIIAGSRSVDPSVDDVSAAIVTALQRWGFPADINYRDVIEEVVSGKADGGDRAGERWAAEYEIPVHKEPVTDEDRRQHGPYEAPKHRNRRMAMRGTHALLFWDGLSGGSADMAIRMLAREKPVHVVPTRKRPPRRRARQQPK